MDASSSIGCREIFLKNENNCVNIIALEMVCVATFGNKVVWVDKKTMH
jgi:hypothetical protein